MNSACDFQVTLLGTGVPTPRPDRFGPTTLIEAGNQKLLIDAGRGAAPPCYGRIASRASSLQRIAVARATPNIGVISFN
jgi:hypothetical protein